MKEQCNVCKAFTVETGDKLCSEIKKRHEGRHTIHTTLSERTGSKISQNTIIGDVKWIPMCEHDKPQRECGFCFTEQTHKLARKDLLLD